MADSSEPLDDTGPAGANEPSDVGNWLASMGAPESLTNMIPKDLREFDVSAVLRLLGGAGSSDDVEAEQTTQSSLELEGSAMPVANQASDRFIRWLPILRE